MTTKIQKWGNSQGIRIPKSFLDELKWSLNEDIVVQIEGTKIIIERSSPADVININDLFDGYEGTYEPAVYDWSEPQGNEVW